MELTISLAHYHIFEDNNRRNLIIQQFCVLRIATRILLTIIRPTWFTFLDF